MATFDEDFYGWDAVICHDEAEEFALLFGGGLNFYEMVQKFNRHLDDKHRNR